MTANVVKNLNHSMRIDKQQLTERVGKRLRLCRVHAGLTQPQLASMTGLSMQCITQAEAGNIVSLHVFASILNALHGDANAVLWGKAPLALATEDGES